MLSVLFSVLDHQHWLAMMSYTSYTAFKQHEVIKTGHVVHEWSTRPKQLHETLSVYQGEYSDKLNKMQ